REPREPLNLVNPLNLVLHAVSVTRLVARLVLLPGRRALPGGRSRRLGFPDGTIVLWTARWHRHHRALGRTRLAWLVGVHDSLSPVYRPYKRKRPSPLRVMAFGCL